MSDTVTDGATPAPVEAAPIVEAAEAAPVETTQVEATATDDDGADDTAQTEVGHKPAKGVQKRLDELTRQKHETARDRDYWRDLAIRATGGEQKPNPSPPAGATDKPQVDQFDTYEDFTEALTDWKVEQTLASRDRQSAVKTQTETAMQKLAAGSAARPDFNDVVADIPATPAVQSLLAEADNAAEILYQLGNDPAALAKFATLSSAMQGIELGKIAARLDAPKTRTASPPPNAPPSTVSGISSAVNKDPKDMSMAEYIEFRQRK
jgi:hypothetical protein